MTYSTDKVQYMSVFDYFGYIKIKIDSNIS